MRKFLDHLLSEQPIELGRECALYTPLVFFHIIRIRFNTAMPVGYLQLLPHNVGATLEELARRNDECEQHTALPYERQRGE